MDGTVKQKLIAAASALALTMVLSGVALAHDDDDYYRQGSPQQARNYGYQNGYSDGAKHGRHEGREHDPNDYHPPDWNRSRHGYKNWMGPVSWYQRGYQEGYENGFRDAYNGAAWNDGYRDRDSYRDVPRENWSGGGWRNDDNVAYRFGYDDGSTAARSDIELGKPYNSRPRGRYDDRDNGYRRDYGSKDRYRAEYTNGYQAGYDANYRY